MRVRVAIVGVGAWGANLLRVISASARADVVTIADLDPAARERSRALAPLARRVATLDEALSFDLDAVVIATPPSTHARLVLAALEIADVLVEKPLATSIAEAEACVTRAAELGRVAMVGHVLSFHPAIERAIEIARAGQLGELTSMTAWRLSFRGDADASALWTLGPHDLALLHALDDRPLASIAARASGADGNIEIDARLVGGLTAKIHLARRNATKERRLVLTGRDRALTFDDVRARDRLRLGDGRDAEEIRVTWEEPLEREVDHFLRCVESRSRPRTPLEEGAWVVRALSQAAIEEPIAEPRVARAR